MSAIDGLDVLGRVEREVEVMSERSDSGGLTAEAKKAYAKIVVVLPKIRAGYLEVVGSVSAAA